jgi:hypothetical protein
MTFVNPLPYHRAKQSLSLENNRGWICGHGAERFVEMICSWNKLISAVSRSLSQVSCLGPFHPFQHQDPSTGSKLVFLGRVWPYDTCHEFRLSYVVHFAITRLSILKYCASCCTSAGRPLNFQSMAAVHFLHRFRDLPKQEAGR